MTLDFNMVPATSYANADIQNTNYSESPSIVSFPTMVFNNTLFLKALKPQNYF